MKTITHFQALLIIKHHGQTLFGVKFIKQDHTLRSMTCKLHAVNKAVEANQTGIRQAPNKNPYMVKVWDMNKSNDYQPATKGAFRTINVQSLIELSINGETYKVVEKEQ